MKSCHIEANCWSLSICVGLKQKKEMFVIRMLTVLGCGRCIINYLFVIFYDFLKETKARLFMMTVDVL